MGACDAIARLKLVETLNVPVFAISVTHNSDVRMTVLTYYTLVSVSVVARCTNIQLHIADKLQNTCTQTGSCESDCDLLYQYLSHYQTYSQMMF